MMHTITARRVRRWQEQNGKRDRDKDEPYRKPAHEKQFNAAVNKMFNKVRNEWARAGYPGLKTKDITKLRPYGVA